MCSLNKLGLCLERALIWSLSSLRYTGVLELDDEIGTEAALVSCVLNELLDTASSRRTYGGDFLAKAAMTINVDTLDIPKATRINTMRLKMNFFKNQLIDSLGRGDDSQRSRLQ